MINFTKDRPKIKDGRQKYMRPQADAPSKIFTTFNVRKIQGAKQVWATLKLLQHFGRISRQS